MAALAAFCSLVLGIVDASAQADIRHIGPHWEAAQILAEHPRTEEVLITIYERLRTGSQPAHDKIALGVAEDYAYADDGSQRIIVDAKLRRIISIDLASGSFRHDSVYSIAGFVDYEAQNRVWMGEVLRSAGGTGNQAPSNFDTFWIESDLGNTIEDQPRPEIGLTENGAVMAFSYGGMEVATATFSDQALSSTRQDRLRNLLRLLTKLHPDALEKIVAVGRLPRTLTFRMPSDPGVSATVYTLASVRTETSVFPLPVDAERGFTGDHPFYAKVLPVLEAAVAGTWQSGPKSWDAYFTQIRDAVNRNAWFEAWMLYLELNLLIADVDGGCDEAMASAGYCVSIGEYWTDLERDERGRLYFEAAEIQNSDPVRAVDIWRSIPLDDVANPYLMGVFVGNVVSTHSQAFEAAPIDPYEMFTTAITANPYVSSFYKDLGDHFRRQLEFDLAWICYDLGRALPNRPTDDVLEQADQIESYLRQRVPQLF